MCSGLGGGGEGEGEEVVGGGGQGVNIYENSSRGDVPNIWL